MLCHVIICNSDSWCGPFKRVMLFSFVSPCYCCGQIPEIWELDHPVGGYWLHTWMWNSYEWFEILWKVLTPLDDWNAILFHASSSSSYRSVTFFSFGMSLTNHCDWLEAHDSTAFCGKKVLRRAWCVAVSKKSQNGRKRNRQVTPIIE